MTLFKKIKRAARVFSLALLAVNAALIITTRAYADADTKITCKAPVTTAAIDLKTLGINISSAVPIGSTVYEGTMTVNVDCGINFTQWKDGLTAEVYFKPYSIPEDSLGYGLSLYLGYGGQYSNEAGSIPTGHLVDTYAGIATGGSLNNYTAIMLNVPFKIVRTSSSMTAIAGRSNLNLFRVGSQVEGSDENFVASNLKYAATVIDETCDVAGNRNQNVSLGSYSVSKSSGFGSGIGQTTSAIPFAIKLNCEALLSGTFDVMMQFNGDAVSGLSDSGVVALNSASTATGVGVQILNSNQQPIALATPFAVASYPLSDALVTVPLFARYYQTASTVSPGTANAVASYTISYQ